MKTIGEVLRLSADFLKTRGLEKGRRIAEELLAASFGLPRLDLYLQFDKPVEEAELILLRGRLKRCANGEPVQYVIGEVGFYGARIKVDHRVLIPRPETEILVDLIAKQSSKGVLWDICAGSGCIGIALKKAEPGLDVTLSDLSKGALELASHNAKFNDVDVSLVQGDLAAPFLGKKADIVVCNPPYIRASEYSHLHPSVRDYEPKEALIGGEVGTEFYERLALELPPLLNPGAHLFLELGAGQGEAVKQIFGGRGRVEKDWAGHDRFFFLEMQ
jgi:release factor glutamine methyltransferase